MKTMILMLLVFFSYSSSISEAAEWNLIKKDNQSATSKLQHLEIIGGDEATPHAYPYQAALLINSRSLCGGSLISQNYVLTAAHCAAAVKGSLVIILGAHNITDPEPTQIHMDPADIIIHENYSSITFQNDIALIRLASPAPLNNVISAITLPFLNDANRTYYNQTVTSIGWGLTKDVISPTLADTSSVLRTVNVSVMSLTDCEQYYNDQEFDIQYVTDLNLCTSGQGKRGTCDGDSGGPLILEGKQIGVVSTGTTSCEINSPSVYTSTGKFLNWIQQNSDLILH